MTDQEFRKEVVEGLAGLLEIHKEIMKMLVIIDKRFDNVDERFDKVDRGIKETRTQMHLSFEGVKEAIHITDKN